MRVFCIMAFAILSFSARTSSAHQNLKDPSIDNHSIVHSINPFDAGSVDSSVITAKALFDEAVRANYIDRYFELNANIWRGSRPTKQDLAWLAGRGVKTIITVDSDRNAIREETEVAKKLGLEIFVSPMSWTVSPSDAQVNEILAVMNDPSKQPVFVHCKHGEDRTGLIIALYRIESMGWNPHAAYEEMLNLGFHPKLKALDDYFRERSGY